MTFIIVILPRNLICYRLMIFIYIQKMLTFFEELILEDKTKSKKDDIQKCLFKFIKY